MALKTLHFVQGLSGTPLIIFLDISPPDFPTIFGTKTNLENRNLKIQKPRFTNRCPDKARHLLVNLEKTGVHEKLDLLTPYGN